MINLEQVKLLETKVSKTVDYVGHLIKENTALRKKEANLQTQLEANQKRIDELEVLVMGFKEEQGKIEEGILAALDRLSQFEKAMEKGLKAAGDGKTCFEIPEGGVPAEPANTQAEGGDLDIY